MPIYYYSGKQPKRVKLTDGTSVALPARKMFSLASEQISAEVQVLINERKLVLKGIDHVHVIQDPVPVSNADTIVNVIETDPHIVENIPSYDDRVQIDHDRIAPDSTEDEVAETSDDSSSPKKWRKRRQ